MNSDYLTRYMEPGFFGTVISTPHFDEQHSHFAGELMATHPDLELIDYGFAYRRDKNFPGDDLTWFLVEKR